MRDMHLTIKEIIKILDGETLARDRENHLFNCKYCFGKVMNIIAQDFLHSQELHPELLKLLLSSEITIRIQCSSTFSKPEKGVDASFYVQLPVFELFKGTCLSGTTFRGEEREYSNWHPNRYGITVQGENLVLDVRPLKDNKFEIEILESRSGKIEVLLTDERGKIIRSYTISGEGKLTFSAPAHSRFWLTVKHLP